jgi:hypothetical protein
MLACNRPVLLSSTLVNELSTIIGSLNCSVGIQSWLGLDGREIGVLGRGKRFVSASQQPDGL